MAKEFMIKQKRLHMLLKIHKKKVVQKTTEATGDLIRHKMTNKTVGKSKDSIISDPLEF